MKTVPMLYSDAISAYLDNKKKLLLLAIVLFFIEVVTLYTSGLTPDDTISDVASKTIISSVSVYAQLLLSILVMLFMVKKKLLSSQLKIGVFRLLYQYISSMFIWMMFVLLLVGTFFFFVGDEAIVKFLTDASDANKEVDGGALIYSLIIASLFAFVIYLSSVFIAVYTQQAIINHFAKKGELNDRCRVGMWKLPFYSIVNLFSQWRLMLGIVVIVLIKILMGYLNSHGYPIVSLAFSVTTAILFVVLFSSASYVGAIRLKEKTTEFDVDLSKYE